MYIYRMSSVGDCPKQLSYERLGYAANQAPEWLNSAAEEGHWHEARIKDELRAAGYYVNEELVCPVCLNEGMTRQGLHLEYTYGNLFRLVGHTDGEVITDFKDEETPRLIEIKSMSSIAFNKWKRYGFEEFPAYKAQLACYMTVGKYYKCDYIVKDRESGQKITTTFDYLQDTWIAEEFERILFKLADIENLALNNELCQKEYDASQLECRRCYQFKDMCAKRQTNNNEIDKTTLNSIIENWRINKLRLEEAKKNIENCQYQIGDFLASNNTDRITYNNVFMQKIEVRPSVSYPIGNLLKIFTKEQLSPAATTKDGYSYVRITDFNNKEDEREL